MNFEGGFLAVTLSMFQTFKPYVTLTGGGRNYKNVQGIDRNTKISRGGEREKSMDKLLVSLDSSVET